MDEIRKIVKNDITDLKHVLNTIELFPAEMLDEMLLDYFDNPKTKEIWFTFIQDKKHWGYMFRFGFFEIPHQDFELIADGMKVKHSTES